VASGMNRPRSQICRKNTRAKRILKRRAQGRSTLHQRTLPIKQKRQGRKQERGASEGQKVEYANFKDTHSEIHEYEIGKRRKMTVAHAAAFQVISGRTVDDPFRYQPSVDKKLTIPI